MTRVSREEDSHDDLGHYLHRNRHHDHPSRAVFPDHDEALQALSGRASAARIGHMEYLIKGFIYVWISIIAFIPNAFMGGLAICIVATLITYIERSRSN
jgi:hypothetical protein